MMVSLVDEGVLKEVSLVVVFAVFVSVALIVGVFQIRHLERLVVVGTLEVWVEAGSLGVLLLKRHDSRTVF